MPDRKRTAARIAANGLPAYRVYAGFRTAELLRTDMRSPWDRTWKFAGRVAIDAVTDIVDGHLARYAGTTRFGGYLDQMADKAWFLLIARQLAKNNEIPRAYVTLPIIRDVGITAIRPIAQHYGINSDARKSGKVKMNAQVMATIAACSPIANERPDLLQAFYGLAAGASAVSGLDTLAGYMDDLADREPNSKAAKLLVASSTWLSEN